MFTTTTLVLHTDLSSHQEPTGLFLFLYLQHYSLIYSFFPPRLSGLHLSFDGVNLVYFTFFSSFLFHMVLSGRQ